MSKVEKGLLPHPRIALSTPFYIARGHKRGVALILTVGVLALILIVGTSLAINTILDFKSSKNFKNNTEAEYLAEAGINRAVSELLYGTEGFVNDAVDSSTEAWAQWTPSHPVYSTAAGNGGYRVDSIYDCAGQIYINDANPNLKKILENLAAGVGLTAADGDAIFDNRGAGYTTKEQVMSIPGFSQAKYDAIKKHITVCAFVDPDVINPLDATTPYAAAPRAPVNVNTASTEVLTAVLTGISDGTNTITAANAAQLAQHLFDNRPYATYDQLWSALLSAETLGYIFNGDAAVVMANANPNTDLMRANPNYSWRYKHVSRGNPGAASGYDANGVPFAVDKTKLAAYTTEFCFSSGGYYEINATGFVNDAAGNQVAAKSLQAVMKLFDIWRQTTQAEFAQGTVNNTALYPESAQVAAAAYDGQVMLSMLHSTTPSAGISHFRVTFQGKMNNLDADSGGGNTARQSLPGVQLNPNVASAVDTSNAGNLFPDGLFFPRDDAVTNYWFYPDNNVDANEGTLEIWFKPNWHHQYVSFPISFNAGKIIEIQSRGTSGGPTWSTSDMDIYIAANSNEVHWRINNKNGYPAGWYTWPRQMPASWKPGTWHHIATTWNFTGIPTYSQDFYLDGSAAPTWNIHDPPNPFSGDQGLEIGQDSNYQEPPNVTYGEVRIFPSSSATSPGADFAAGVYYNGGDASFASSSNAVGAARLGTISWTEHVADVSGNPIVPGADITFDVFDGANWIGNSSSRSNPGGNPLNIVTGGAGDIRYSAYFLESGDGLYDTPVLDDVTITYQKRAKILYWRKT